MNSVPRSGSRAFGPVVGWFLVAAAALLAVGSVAAFGEYPPGLSQPFAVVLAASAVTLLITGVLALGFPRWPATRPSPSPVAVAGLVVGLASLIAFAVLVGTNLSMNADTTIPTAARWVPVLLGAVALVAAAIGLWSARGDGLSRRMSLAGGVLGLGVAATTLWLSAANCWLFVDHAAGCSMP
jgi:hypothetical protein